MSPAEPVERMIAYLLGELPETESARLEERYFAEEGIFRQLQAIEMELYDAYARGALSEDRRLQFEHRLLSTPEQLRRLEFSRALIQARSSRRQLPLWLRHPKAGVGVAAALAIAFAVWWTASHRPRLQIAGPPTELHPQIPAQTVVAFTLVPGTARDAGVESILDVPAGADLVRLSAEMEADSHPSYHAVLRTPEGAEVWKKGGLHSQPRGAATAVVLEIPGSLLVSGHYALTLSGDNLDGTSEDLADYSFRVRKT